jgi:hypothetical protein
VKKAKPEVEHHIDISPVAPYETRRTLRSANRWLAIYDAIRSGFSPGADGPKTRYGRAFLFFGTILVVIVFGGIIVFGWMNAFRGPHH